MMSSRTSTILVAAAFCLAAVLGVVRFASAQRVDTKRVTIEGRLLKADGKPLAYTEIELVPVGSTKITENYDLIAVSIANGSFYFANVPPGRYTLSINFDGKPSELSPYETVYYPHSPERSSATEFAVEYATRIRGLVFRLPPALERKVLVGRVLWDDGEPVYGAMIGFWDAAYDVSLSFGEPRSDKNGRFSVVGFSGRKYQFGAIVFDKETYKPFQSPGNVIASGESKVFVVNASTGIIEFRVKRSKDANKLLDKYVGMILPPGLDIP
jgi:hypothetical protein